jgi:murein DD-endopeptidase MepM/ murein hydrolase activator NlpD
LRSPGICCCYLALLCSLASGVVSAAEDDHPTSNVSLAMHERPDGGAEVVCKSIDCLEATVTVYVTSTNLKAARSLPWTFVVRDKPEVLTFQRVQPNEPWQLDFTFNWRPGGMTAEHDSRAVYQLPYPADQHYTVAQGNLSKGGHRRGGGDDYAIDWGMPEGSTVCSARAGKVVAVKQDSKEGGPTQNFNMDANYVIVRHADGTFGEYMHLQHHGVLVRVGEDVAVGTPLGRSGNTGYSSGPHLHFGVFVNRDGSNKTSIPLRWKTASGVVSRLIEGRQY